MTALVLVSIPKTRPSSRLMTTKPKLLQNVNIARQAYNVDDAFADLEMMLGETTTEAFSVEVSCEDDVLSGQTGVLASQSCHIRRSYPESIWSVNGTIEAEERTKTRVQQHVIYHIATHNSPALALKSLSKTFGVKKDHLACREYLALVREELEYQFHLQQEKHGQQHQQAATVPHEHKNNGLQLSRSHSPCLGRFSFEHHHAKFQQPLRSLTAPSSHGFLQMARRPTPESLATATNVVHDKLSKENLSAEDEHTDPASKIWRHMRRDSKAAPRRPPPLQEQEQQKKGSGDHDVLGLSEALRELKRSALRNKRSVGADTLKSLAASCDVFGEKENAEVEEGMCMAWR